jgi:hypothetical protein
MVPQRTPTSSSSKGLGILLIDLVTKMPAAVETMWQSPCAVLPSHNPFCQEGFAFCSGFKKA